VVILSLLCSVREAFASASLSIEHAGSEQPAKAVKEVVRQSELALHRFPVLFGGQAQVGSHAWSVDR
jgi:hypothetical protein